MNNAIQNTIFIVYDYKVYYFYDTMHYLILATPATQIDFFIDPISKIIDPSIFG